VPTITATADNTKSQVRLDLDFSDIDAPYAYVARVDPTTGASTPVRGHGTSFTIGGLPYTPMQAGYKATLYDTEAPSDSAVYYTATAPSVTMNANAKFTSGYTEPWYATATTVTVRAIGARGSVGTQFLAVQSDGATAVPVIRGEEVPATPGATLSLTVTVSSNVSQSITIGLLALDSSGATLATGAVNNPTVLASTTLTASVVCPANTVSVRPTLQINGTPAATSIASFSSAAVTNAAGTAISSGVSVQSLGACWLKDPLRPGSNVRVDFAFDPNPQCTPTEGVFFQGMDAEQRGANAAAFNVNNQAAPIVVSKVRSSLTSTLTLVSRTFADRDRLNALLAPDSPLLFQVPDEYGVPDQYLSVGTTSVARVLPDHRFPIRVFSLPFASTSTPGGPMQGTVGTRWSDMCNRYASWSAVTAAALTWVQILDGLAG
jgi:hypothetical protein